MTESITIREITGAQTTTRVFAALLREEVYGAGFPIGAITVDDKVGYVCFVGVSEDFRRKGIATALLAHAREATGLALDTDDGQRTTIGNAWARSVGLERGGDPVTLGARETEAMCARLMLSITYNGEIAEEAPA